MQADAEYFTEQLVLSASRSSRVSLVERRNLQELLEEQKIQLSGLTDSESVAKLGEIMNAQILVLGVPSVMRITTMQTAVLILILPAASAPVVQPVEQRL